MSICVQVLFEHLFSVLLSIYLGAEMLGHIAILCLIYWRITKLFSLASPFYIPPAMYNILISLHPCQYLSFVFLLSSSYYYYYYHPIKYEGLPHCGFILHFPEVYWRFWASLHRLVDHLYIFIGDMSFQVFCPFSPEFFVFIFFLFCFVLHLQF